MWISDVGRKRKLRNMLFIIFLVQIALIIRIGFIQFVQGAELQAMAYSQQTLNRTINPKRGRILDRNGKIELAVSASTETVSVNPTNISANNKQKVARALSEIFDLDYEKTLKKVSKKTSIEIIVKKVDKEKTDKLRIWLAENNITTGINIDEDTKRYYPYSTLASNIIGFTGSDNQGLEGLESYYDDILSGKQGKILKLTDATGTDMGVEGEDYIAAEDGDDIILTIDMTIQSMAEKYLKQACIDNACTDGGNVIIMNPKTGDILAMATYPNYDLNSPYEINNEELKSVWDTLSGGEKSNYLLQMWRNKAISDTYEPGSTFKLVTSSAALQEGITDTDRAGEFHCSGSITIAGARIKCWRYYRPHGSQSLRQALMNSCNPVFIGIGQKLGIHTYYSYLEKFGLLTRTGIDLPGEANSIFLKEEKVGPVELATISFGQRFEITPLHMTKIVGTIANGGKAVNPRLVKSIIDTKKGEIKQIAIKQGEQVISKENADKILNMMQSVVDEGTGKNAKVEGYNIGGKTGTSEDGVNTGKRIASFVGVADVKDPEVVIVVILYNPTGQGGHQGGGVAAPVAGQILGEVLPYMEISREDKEIKEIVEMPNVTGITYYEAKKLLKEAGIETNSILEAETIITDQVPKAGIKITNGTKVILYGE
jgi:stage V sporulation protein D (sporulation-specific penicillin-binding protein)